MDETPSIDRFIIASDEDLIYVREARQLLLANGEPDTFVNPTACRILATLAVAGLEMMIRELARSDRDGILAPYFAESRGKRPTNKDRVDALYERFGKAGIKVRRDILDDYLVMKYIRNVVEHSDPWKPHEKQWIQERGFPVELTALSEGHWERMQVVEQEMLKYVGAAGIPLMRAIVPDTPPLRRGLAQRRIVGS